MPELPEVEVVRRGLTAHLIGETIKRVQVLHPRPIRHHLAGADDFELKLVEQTIVGVNRRGKYLWLSFASGDALLCHLGMSGQMLVKTAPALPAKHLRVLFQFEQVDLELWFVDQRMFGGLRFSWDGAELPAEIAHIALDPLAENFEVAATVARIQSSNSAIKRQLLNQQIVSGIGNIYADEALWQAKIHGETSGSALSKAKLVGLLTAAQEVMQAALAQGGTSFDSLYVNVAGESGYFARSLHAYGREAQPCDRCGVAIIRESFMNRSSFSCPKCQPRK